MKRVEDVSSLCTQVDLCIADAVDALARRQHDDGRWVDRLTASAVSTALGAIALHRSDPDTHADRVRSAESWLLANQRADGGWSDADRHPPSSKSGTAFAVAALTALAPEDHAEPIRRGMEYLDAAGGVDRVPGMRGPGPRSWPAAAAVAWSLVGLRPLSDQPYQPIEVMLLPSTLRNKVSIALPGVLGLGMMQAAHLDLPVYRRALRCMASPFALRWLRSVQGPNGGVEECPMLAALILIGLRAAWTGTDVADACERYLKATQRSDGSWAIDRDLELAVTTYAVSALTDAPPSGEPGGPVDLDRTRRWLLDAQWTRPFRPLRMRPGGWSWNMPSGWPECDDTAGALCALRRLGVPAHDVRIRTGRRWLVDRQNRNGSWSEWVRNGALLNDKPCPGVTAQVLMSLHATACPGDERRTAGAVLNGLTYLGSAQSEDGSYPSLWFRGRVFATAKVFECLAQLRRGGSSTARRAESWLLDNQDPDGSWGRRDGELRGTVEETAWAGHALLVAGRDAGDPMVRRAVEYVRGQATGGEWPEAAVGLYFDDLRYADDLIAHTAALRFLRLWRSRAGSTGNKPDWPLRATAARSR